MRRRPVRARGPSGDTTAAGRAAVVGISCTAMGLGCSPAFLYGYLGPEIRGDLDMSRATLGLLIGIFYGLTGLSSFLAARVSEQLGARSCIVLDLALLAACLTATVASGSVWTLALAAGLAGAGYAFGNAGTSMAVTATAPPGRVAQDLTVKTAGVPTMATLLAVAGPSAGNLVGWQSVAAALALLAACAAVAGVFVLPAHGVVTVNSLGVRRDQQRHLPRGFVLLPVAAFLFIGGSQPLLSWLVLSLTDAGMAATTAGIVSAAGTGIGVLAMVLVSRLSDRAGSPRRGLIAAGLAAVAFVGVLVLWQANGGPLVLVLGGAILGLCGNLAGASTIHAVVVDRVPWAVGRGIGLMSTGYFMGALVAPWAFGAAADATGDYNASWAGCAAALFGSALCFAAVHRWVAVPHGRRGQKLGREALNDGRLHWESG